MLKEQLISIFSLSLSLFRSAIFFLLTFSDPHLACLFIQLTGAMYWTNLSDFDRSIWFSLESCQAHFFCLQQRNGSWIFSTLTCYKKLSWIIIGDTSDDLDYQFNLFIDSIEAVNLGMKTKPQIVNELKLFYLPSKEPTSNLGRECWKKESKSSWIGFSDAFLTSMKHHHPKELAFKLKFISIASSRTFIMLLVSNFLRCCYSGILY